MANLSTFIVQYCPTLGKACGISTYTQMLSAAQGFITVRSVDELRSQPCTDVHVQHEFGIFTMRDLRALRAHCYDNDIRFHVTMHTVIPLPTMNEYLKIRFKRLLRRINKRLILRPAGMFIRFVDRLLWNRYFNLWERADEKKRSFGGNPTSPKRWAIQHPQWVWTKDNPEYGWKSFRHFRRTQMFFIRHADTIVVHNREAKDALDVMGATQVQVIAHGLQAFPTSTTLLSAQDGKLHVGCFGFMKAHKSLLDIIAACAMIPNIRLHIYASVAHDDKHSAYYAHLLSAIAGKDWIELDTAFLPLDAVVYRLSQCDVNVWYCAPPGAISVSGSIRQYLAALRPIIASNTVMISDIREFVTAVPYGSNEALAAAIRSRPPVPQGIAAYVETHGWERLRPHYHALV